MSLKGFKQTKEHIEKRRLAHIGLKHSIESKIKMKKAHSGMKKPWAGKFKPTEETKIKMSESHKGKNPYIMTDRVRKNMSLSQMGKKLSEETKQKISETNKRLGRKPPYSIGEKHPRWRGGFVSEYSRIRGSDKYKQWKQNIFIRDNFTCQDCGDKKGGNLNSHHKKSFKKLLQEVKKYLPLFDLYTGAMLYAPLWDLNNGITLCEKCHKKRTKKLRYVV